MQIERARKNHITVYRDIYSAAKSARNGGGGGVRLGTGQENEAPGRKCNFCSSEMQLVKSSLDEPWMTWKSCVVWINWKSCLMKCRLKVTVLYFQNFICIFIQFNIQIHVMCMNSFDSPNQWTLLFIVNLYFSNFTISRWHT